MQVSLIDICLGWYNQYGIQILTVQFEEHDPRSLFSVWVEPWYKLEVDVLFFIVLSRYLGFYKPLND